MSTDTPDHLIDHLLHTIAHLNFLLGQEVENHRATQFQAQDSMQAWETSRVSLAACLEASNAYVLFLEEKVHQLTLEKESQNPEKPGPELEACTEDGQA